MQVSQQNGLPLLFSTADMFGLHIDPLNLYRSVARVAQASVCNRTHPVYVLYFFSFEAAHAVYISQNVSSVGPHGYYNFFYLQIKILFPRVN